MAIENMVDLTVRLPAELASELVEKGKMEIAFRRIDKKFRQMLKAEIINNAPSQEARQKMIEAVVNKAGGEGYAVNNLLRNINLADKDIDVLRNLNVDMRCLQQLSETVSKLQYVQIGLAAANIVVDIVGFLIIANKIDGLSKQLDSIRDEIKKVQQIQAAEITETCRKLCMEFNSFVDKIQSGKVLDREKLEVYLINVSSFILKLLDIIKDRTIEPDTILNMIYSLLPAYTSLLCVFLKAYYFEEHRQPKNYESFLKIYQELNSAEFRNTVQEYYLIDKGFAFKDVVSILQVHMVTLINERLEIDDQLQLVEAFSDDETYRKFEEHLDKIAREQMVERADEIAAQCGDYSDECKRILQAVA